MTAVLLFLARWFSGYPLDGRFRTDASWARAGEQRQWQHHVPRWHYWPWLKRGAIRTGATMLAVVLAVAYHASPAAFTGTATVIIAAAVYAVGWWMVWKVRNWRHHRDWVNPFNLALPPGVTVAELTRARDRARLALPPGFTGDDKDKQLILQAATAKLNPAGTLEAGWSLHGKRPEVTIKLVKPPPGYVGFPAIRAYADAAEEHQVCLGLGRISELYPDGEPIIISVNLDSPHLGVSAESGGSKSVTARNASAQFAHHGALIAVLDAKLTSQHWAAGLRNVAYARNPEEIHALALWLAKEVHDRNKIVLHNSDVEGQVHGSVGPRVIGILEELNITQGILAAYWKSLANTDESNPALGKGKSPAVLALDFVAFSGRAVNVNLIYIGQRLSAKATSAGSGDARENLGVLLMSNPTQSTWKMLVGDRHALPPASDVRGRLQVVTAGKVTEVQGAFLTGAQARDYATSGEVAVAPDDMPCVGGLAPLGTPERLAQDVPDLPAIEARRPDLQIVPDSPRPALSPPRITIPEAVEEEISGPTYEAVRKQLRRDLRDGKPVPARVGRRGNADEYDRVEWCDWEEARRQPRRKVR